MLTKKKKKKKGVDEKQQAMKGIIISQER